MTKYYTTYKCRFCGETFYINRSAQNRDIAARGIMDYAHGGNPLIATPRQTKHWCSDGAVGIADFVGMQPLDAELPEPYGEDDSDVD